MLGFFGGGEDSQYYKDFVALEQDKHTLDHGVWDFMYSFDMALAREAGCFDAEDGEDWNQEVCIEFKKVISSYLYADGTFANVLVFSAAFRATTSGW